MGKQAKAPPPAKKEPPRQRPKPKPKGDAEETQTKAEREEEKRQYVEDLERQKDDFYQQELAKKLSECKPIEESVTYVEDKDSRKPKAIPDLSEFWRVDLGILP